MLLEFSTDTFLYFAQFLSYFFGFIFFDFVCWNVGMFSVE